MSETAFRSLTEQISGRCKHFTGIRNETCKAGVNYLQLAGGTRKGYACRIPCNGDDGCSWSKEDKVVPCALREFPTREEVAAQEAEIKAALAKHLSNFEDGICPECQAKVEEYRQVARCVYASPCGHRQYQGKAPTDKPSLIVEEYPDWDDES